MAGKPERMYFVVLVVGTLAFVITTLLSLVITRLVLPFPGLHWAGFGLAAVVGALPCYFLGHFTLALPQAALTGKVNLRQICLLYTSRRSGAIAGGAGEFPLSLL